MARAAICAKAARSSASRSVSGRLARYSAEMAPRSPPPGSGTAMPQASSPGDEARKRPSASTTLRAVAMACAATPSQVSGRPVPTASSATGPSALSV